MKKQQQAFNGNKKMLKGGLHCHTTRSDGAGDPADVIRLHHKNGYDFLAITDHRNYNYINYAPEVPMTIIPGMEFDSTFEYNGDGFRCFHTVCLGPSKEEGNGFEQDVKLPTGKSTCQEEYQHYLDDIHAKKNITIHCHPEWSNTPARYFDKLEGNVAIEVWNTGAAMGNECDTDAAYWDELLGMGKRLWGVAADDGHGMNGHCKGWVMVNSENNINAILEAIKDGAFYSSCGPEIYDFYIEDGKAIIECSPASRIRFHSDKHTTKVRRGENGALITRAELELDDTWQKRYEYVRAVVIDENGKKAWTNPIFVDWE
ncbi:MAG: CehA/McbA family metallohydrolase [Clostridia bacterium]|nr:CehA/McbA family metallohydrolase [Clostridia bacterium]